MRSVNFRRLRRLPLLWWFAVLAIAAAGGMTVTTAVARSQAAAARLEGTVPVFLAAGPIEPGQVIEVADVRRSDWPRALLPDATVATDPVGRPARLPIDGGEPLTETKVGREGISAVAAQLGAGERAIAVAADEATPTLRPGDHVDVLATFEAPGPTGEPTSVVATSARVLERTEEAVTLAVPVEAATRVAFAATSGAVTLVAAPGIEDAVREETLQLQ